MSNFIQIGSKNHFYNPIQELLSLSNRIHKKYSNIQNNNNNFAQILAYIPAIEGNKIDSILIDVNSANLKSKLQKFGYESIDFLTLEKQFPIILNYPDIKNILIYYFCIYWYIDSSTQYDFSTILSLLNITRENMESTDLTIHDFCFELILDRAISISKSNTESAIFIPLFLTYIMTLKNLPNTSFYLLYTLFNIASSTDNENDLNLLYETIEYIFINNFDFLKSNDYSLLLDTLKINFNNLDSRSLKILGIVTHRGKASIRIMEIIHTLYKQFYEFILSNCEENELQSPFQLTNEDKSKLIRFEKQTKIPKLTYKFDVDEKNFHFIQFPYSILSFKNKKIKILNDTVYSKLEKITEFLSCASNDVVLDFIAQFSVFLNKEKFFFEICESFIEILMAAADSKTIGTIVELLSQSKLFLPSITIFDALHKSDQKSPQFYLDDRINYLRYRVFELISITDPIQVSILISSSQYYPFLFTEHLIRILLKFDKFSPQIFYKEPTKTIIIFSGLDIGQLSSQFDVIKYVYLTFIKQALINKDSCDSLYSFSLFVTSFLSYVYQPEFQPFILNTLQKSFSNMSEIESKKYSCYIVDFYKRMTKTSIDEIKEDFRYQLLIEKTFSVLIIGLQYNISIAHNFVSLFDTLLTFISVSPSINLILICLKLFQIFSFTEKKWRLSSRHFLILHSSIDKLCDDCPDDRIITSLFCCLGNSSFLESRESIVIVYPSILPLLFLIHSKSRGKNVELLKIFNGLCKYSDNNALAFHEAFIDLILIRFLCLENDVGKISFFCHDFEFNINRNEAIPIVLDFLWQVVQSRPNYSITSSMVNLLTITKDERILNFIVSMLYNGGNSFSKMTKIPLDSSEPVLCVNGFDWSTLKSTFVLDFYLSMDEMISKRYRFIYTLFQITDDSNTLRINISNGSLQAVYKTTDKSSSAFLFKNIFNQKRSHFSITFITTKDKTKIFNFLNGERFSDASMERIVFNRNVRMLIGGSDFVSKTIGHPCFGKIFAFQFFTCKLTEDEMTLLNEEPSQFPKKPLFSTNFIKSEAIRTYPIEYKDSINGGILKLPSKSRLIGLDRQFSSSSQFLSLSNQQGQNQQGQNQQGQKDEQETIQKISLDLLSSFHRSYHIIDFFCEISLYPKYLQIERLDILLDVLYCIFTKHQELQKYFKPYFNTLFNHVLEKVELRTYLSLFRFMSILVNESMRLEWFEMFIINIVLWSKSKDFKAIVNHWNNTLIQYKFFFIDKNYLNDLLTQFMLRFQFEKDPNSNNDEIMTVFCRFMSNIAQLNFDQNSFDILISCILMCEDELNLYELVKILDSVSLTQAAMNSITKKKLQLLHKLFRYQNIELTICSIICLNNLSIVFPDYDCFAISYILIGHQELDKIVEILIEKFPDFPNLMSLLVVLSLQAKKQNLLVDAIKKHFLFDSSKINMIFQRDFWYVWPILLMLNVSEENCKILCDFLAIGIFNLQIANSNDRIPIIDDILILIFRLSFLNPSFQICFNLIESLIELFNKKNCVFPQYISRYCFIFFFFKCPGILHSTPLLQIYEKSDFYKSEVKEEVKEEVKKSSEKMIFNIFELESLLGFDLFSFVFLCRINIDSSLELSESKLKELYLKLDPPNSPVFDKRILTFFTTPYDENNKQNYDYETSYNQLYLFDSFQNEIKSFISTKLNSIRKGILKLFQESRINIANISQDEIRPFTHILLSKASNQLQRTTPKIEKEVQINMKKRENKLTPMLYPFQLKNKANSKKVKNEGENIYNMNNGNRYFSTIAKMFGKPLNKFQCIISKFDYKKNEKAYLLLYENMICFSLNGKKRKFIFFDDIKFFLVRKVKDGFGYEIITDSLSSILFFITHNDFNTLTMELKSYHFKITSLCSFSNDFQSSLADLSKSWLNRRTSNFEYLMKLNILSGRSFSQYHLYPVLPPIVAVYDDLDSLPNWSNLRPNSINSPFDDFFDMSNRQNFTNSLTLMADYFFDFTLVNRGIKAKNDEIDLRNRKIDLPKWAATKFEFIYLNRKKLEKIDVTPFIDKIFGVEFDAANGSFLKLFKKPHEKRLPLKPNFSPLLSEILTTFSSPNSPSQKVSSSVLFVKPTPLSIQEQIESQLKIESQIQMPIQLPFQNEKVSKFKNTNGFVFQLPRKIISSLVFLNQYSQLRFWMVFDNHKLCYVQLYEGTLRIKFEFDLNEIDKDDDDDDLSFFYSQTVVYIYSRRKSTVYYLNISKSISQIPLYTELPLFSIFDDQIIYSQRECSLYKMNIESLIFSRFCLTKSKLTAISSSKAFNIITYATIDGIVHILSYSSTEEINQYNAGFEIKQILITICFGFVVVLGDDQIIALTVNGDFIAQYHFNFLIRNIYSLTICAGIDFVAFDTFDNEIGYFEVFYPQKYKIIKKCNSEVKRVCYNPIDYVFVVVQANGCVELFYHSINM